MNPEPKDNLETIRKRLDALLIASMGRLAILLGVSLTAERINLYLEPLSDLSEKQIERSFKTAARQFKPRHAAFPTPAELIEFAEHNHPSGVLDDSKKYLGLPVKPPDWVNPMSPEEVRNLVRKIREGKK